MEKIYKHKSENLFYLSHYLIYIIEKILAILTFTLLLIVNARLNIIYEYRLTLRYAVCMEQYLSNIHKRDHLIRTLDIYVYIEYFIGQ